MKGIKVLLVSSVAAIGFASCADLGFGVDMDSGISSPYYYGSGMPYYGGYNGGPYFGLDYPFYSPVYSPGFLPPAPPVIGNGPGSIIIPGITIRKHIETPTIKCNENQQLMPNLNYIDLLIFLSFLPSSTLLVHVVCYRTVKDSLTQFYLLR